MLVHPQFDPIAVQVGPLAVHWYGLMYLIGFTLFYLLGLYRCRQEWRGITKANLEDLLFVGMVGVIVGGRLGFVLLYQPEYYLSHPLEIFSVWQGGMSAHGGLIGVMRSFILRGETRNLFLPSVISSLRSCRWDFSSADSETSLMVNSGEELLPRTCPGA